MTKSFMRITCQYFLFFYPFLFFAQSNADLIIDRNFKNTLLLHKELVSIPNLPENDDLMLKNINWVAEHYDTLDFETSLLKTNTHPIILADPTDEERRTYPKIVSFNTFHVINAFRTDTNSDFGKKSERSLTKTLATTRL